MNTTPSTTNPADLSAQETAPLPNVQSGGSSETRRQDGAGFRKIEWAAALALTALALYFHFVFFLNAGALWRDEASGLEVALLPTLRDVWSHGEFDSFPQGWHWALRLWSACGFAGAGDPGWRTLGCLVGTGMLGALWLNARRFGQMPPLLGLVLLGFNSVALIYGDSVRGLGLGSVLALLMMGTLWSLVQKPGPARTLLVLLLALAGVHVMFQNSVVLFAAGLGGMAVALRHRKWGTAALVAAIALVCAFSLLAYAPVFRRASAWNMLLKAPVDLVWIWKRFCVATGLMGVPGKWVWLGAWLLGLAGLLGSLLPSALPVTDGKRRDTALFCGVTLAVGMPAYLIFLKLLSYSINPWYFIVPMVLMAGCLEGSLAPFDRWKSWRVIRLAAAAALAAILFWPVLALANMRMTNMDRIADLLNRQSRPGDFIVINPWEYGTSFQRYYHGPADWTTIPPMADHKLHRYDLLKQHLLHPDVTAPVIDRLVRCLKAGNRIWVVGDVSVLAPGQKLPEPPVWRDSFNNSNVGIYYQIWSLQIGEALRSHALTATNLLTAEDQPVNGFEAPPLFRLEGWKDAAPDQRSGEN